MPRRWITADANEAVASVAYRTHDVLALYPTPPAAPMGEAAGRWARERRANLWGQVPEVAELRSEVGAAGALQGALQAGALATTFTASQGLLLMIPNLYRIAGELLACAVHVAARTVATHAHSVYGDHSDVMAARSTGCALLASGSPQEAHDFALLAQSASLWSRIPFLHFFDGYRTSHELRRIEELGDEDLREMLDERLVAAHRDRALSPERPALRGTAQGPDTFFQAREAVNRFYAACPGKVRELFERFAELTGRPYRLFDYYGHPWPERAVVVMGSAAETTHAAVDALVARGERVGVVKVRLYRPFDAAALAEALPATISSLAVLDRTKEPGAPGEPLYLDVVAALAGPRPAIRVVGGRYGLASKELTPAEVAAVFDELRREAPKNGFTLGLVDDVTHTSLEADESFDAEEEGSVRAVFHGPAAHGVVEAAKSALRLAAEEGGLDVQGTFLEDAHRNGARACAHLRIARGPIRNAYLIRRAGFVAVTALELMERRDVLTVAEPGAVLLLVSPYPAAETWDHLPREAQEEVLAKGLRLYTVNVRAVERETGLEAQTGTVVQAGFFALCGGLGLPDATLRLKESIERPCDADGPLMARRRAAVVDAALARLKEVPLPGAATAARRRPPVVPAGVPEGVRRLAAVMRAGSGDALPVSAFPVDGAWPVGSGGFERWSVAEKIPVWEGEACIQCNQCALVCPHTALRPKVYAPEHLAGAPRGFRSRPCRDAGLSGWLYTLQVSPEDCTGCGLCVEVCPAGDPAEARRKAIRLLPTRRRLGREKAAYEFFRALPELDRSWIGHVDARSSQLLEPLFGASTACPGCGEAPYVRLLTQLFGDRLLMMSARGCAAAIGGHAQAVPFAANGDGRGPAWSCALSEDDAELGFGFRLAVDAQTRHVQNLLIEHAHRVGEELVEEILSCEGTAAATVAEQRRRIERVRERLAGSPAPSARRLLELADLLVPRSVWLVGGAGWAYDLGYRGLHHVLAAGRDTNVLVLDSETYPATAVRPPKAATPMDAARRAARGNGSPDDLGREVMGYGHVYVARVAFGADMGQTIEALLEADAYPGPSLVLACSHCAARSGDPSDGVFRQRRAVDSGAWPLYRFDPRLMEAGEPALRLDSQPAEERRKTTRRRTGNHPGGWWQGAGKPARLSGSASVDLYEETPR